MQYYTDKNKLVLTEYGRNIQQMVEYAMTIENRDERTRCVHTIINIMGNLFPHLRDVNDFKHKLWDHLAMMSDYKLDIDYPYEVPKALVFTTPEQVPYPMQEHKYNRHYGKQILDFIEAAKAYEGAERERLALQIANYMKRSYLKWNRDTVEDPKILEDLRVLSGGSLVLDPATHLSDCKDLQVGCNNQQGKKNFQNRKFRKGKK